MVTQLGLLLLGLVAVLVLAGQLARAAGPPAAPEDLDPFWSGDPRLVVFAERTGSSSETGATLTGERPRARLRHWHATRLSADGTLIAPASGRLAFLSDRLKIPGGATQYRYALHTTTLDGSRPTKLVDDVHLHSPPRWSPTAAQLAVAAGQECGRWGIYVVRSDGSAASARRRSATTASSAAPETT